MKKQFLAKLLVLGMVLAMLPVAALATENAAGTAAGNNNDYPYKVVEDVAAEVIGEYTFSVPTDEAEEPSEPDTPSVPDAPTVDVTGDTANVSFSDAALDSLIANAKDGAVTLPIDAQGAATTVVSVANMTKLAEAGLTVTIPTTACSVTVPPEAALAIQAIVPGGELATTANADGTVTIAVMKDGKAVAVEDIPGGLDIAIPVTVEADEVDAVVLVTVDGAEVELEWEIADGNLKVNITATGDIRIDKK